MVEKDHRVARIEAKEVNVADKGGIKTCHCGRRGDEA
jgi:hypothetical protein